MRRPFYGLCSLLLGLAALVGFILPLIPGLPFAALALVCLKRFSPKLYKKIKNDGRLRRPFKMIER
ncbi:MAG: DUF454 family protein [Aquificae bacterium]|nr:DUF454 family protein [Aquificota bacterium]